MDTLAKPPHEPIRDQGIKAIIALQEIAGITETETSAATGWDGMSVSEKKNTLAAYKTLFGDKK